MIKNITLTLIVLSLLISCGKKGNPEYKVSKKNIEIQIILTNKG
tara:strand:- start:88 stop:219 length:132 start_codon:yes stop_codon:yes gene_type:complete